MNYLWLLAQSDAMPQWLQEILEPPGVVFVFCILFVAIAGLTAFGITKAVIRHRERMAMLEHGFDPDAPDQPA